VAVNKSLTPADALGMVITIKRTALQHKRRELASQIGISYVYLSEIEQGKKEPSLMVLRCIARALHTSSSELLAEAESLIVVLNERCPLPHPHPPRWFNPPTGSFHCSGKEVVTQ
jgi:transcriptional regulator with XRE-family HTH domain